MRSSAHTAFCIQNNTELYRIAHRIILHYTVSPASPASPASRPEGRPEGGPEEVEEGRPEGGPEEEEEEGRPEGGPEEEGDPEGRPEDGFVSGAFAIVQRGCCSGLPCCSRYLLPCLQRIAWRKPAEWLLCRPRRSPASSSSVSI